LAHALASLRPKKEGLLLPTLGQMPHGANDLSKAFKKLLAKAGIDGGIARVRKGTAGRSTSRLSFHSLRHSFTSALANAGVAPELRQKLTGHADLQTHAVYSHHEFEVIRAALNTLPALP
jgi:integrase